MTISKRHEFDTVIMGAGIAGLGVAKALAAKERVLVLNRADTAGTASPRAAGILDPFLGMHAKHAMLPLTLRAFQDFPRMISQIEKATGLSTGYKKTGMVYVAMDRTEEKVLLSRMKWQESLPIRVKIETGKQLCRRNPGLSPAVRSGLFYPAAGKVHAALFMKAYTAWTIMSGVVVRSSPIAPRLEREGSGFRVTTGETTYRARKVVNAAGSWCSESCLLQESIPVRPARGQIFIFRGDARIESVIHSVREHYILPWQRGKYLAGSTVEDRGYKAVTTLSGKKEIMDSLSSLVPAMKGLRVVESWAGLRPRSADDLPVVGKGRIDNYYIATGYFRSGILLGSLLGKLLANTILTGTISPKLELFSPSRFKTASEKK